MKFSRFYLALVAFLLFIPASRHWVSADGGTNPWLLDRTSRLIAEVTQNGKTFENLKELTSIGPRISGSESEARAVRWAKEKMEFYGLSRVWLQPCTVPQWKRGSRERATLLRSQGREMQSLQVAALGGSVGTPPGGISAQVVEVRSLEEVDRLGASLRGKIVFYNQPMDPTLEDKFEAYSKVSPLRVQGASKASQYGAVATLIRSLSTLPDDDHPHTGIMRYSKQYPFVPAAALSTHGANVLSKLLKKDPSLFLKLELSAGPVESVSSFNVVGEITGTEKPNEVFIVGGHLDSWDLGVGAHDDGAGVVQSLEVARAILALGLKPKRTIRIVLFAAEEFGGAGGREFAKHYAAEKKETYIGALESDRGGFAPLGFSASGNDSVIRRMLGWKPYFRLNGGADEVVESQGGGTDTAPLGALGVPEFELLPLSTHYFDYHHSALDVLSAVDPTDLARGAASMAVLSYLAAEEGI